MSDIGDVQTVTARLAHAQAFDNHILAGIERNAHAVFGVLVEIGAAVVVAPHSKAALVWTCTHELYALALFENKQRIHMAMKFTALGDEP